MTSHEQRLRGLADALLVADAARVVSVLRSHDTMYFSADGALLFTSCDEWSDHRLVEAAFQLFVMEDARAAAPH